MHVINYKQSNEFWGVAVPKPISLFSNNVCWSILLTNIFHAIKCSILFRASLEVQIFPVYLFIKDNLLYLHFF
jgi:hypothetical protein